MSAGPGTRGWKRSMFCLVTAGGTARHQDAVPEYGLDVERRPDDADVRRRVAVDHEQVGGLAGYQRTGLVRPADALRRSAGPGPQRRHRREPRLDEQFEFQAEVQAVPSGVGAHRDRHTRLERLEQARPVRLADLERAGTAGGVADRI